MDVETVRDFCLSLPYATEDMAFGPDYLLFRVCGRIFACLGLERIDYFVVKCDPDYAVELRDRYVEIEPAWHWNKRYWNQISMTGTLSDDMIRSLIIHSYKEVVRKIPGKIKAAHPALAEFMTRAQ